MCGNGKCIYYDDESMPVYYDEDESMPLDPNMSDAHKELYAKAEEILNQHGKMAMTNTKYAIDKSIADRDVKCFCGYKGKDSWSLHVLTVLNENAGMGLFTEEEWSITAIAMAR